MQKNIKMKVGVIGAVGTTAIIIQLLHSHGFQIVGILGHEPNNPSRVSGLKKLSNIATELGIPYQAYLKINDSQHINWMREKQPDIIFAVGFSQLISDDWLMLSRLGCVGFHPTILPRGRGRAPLAWIILDERKGAASFFLMGKGADDGPIFIQEPFLLNSDDDAEKVTQHIYKAIKIALNKWLPDLKKGIWNPVPQDELMASYYGKRNIVDGLISWTKGVEEIDRLIKATTNPYPGAFTFFNNQKMIIWKSQKEEALKIKGVIGRVLLKKNKDHLLVQCRDGLLWIIDYSIEDNSCPIVGSKLGYNADNDIYLLWKEIKKIEMNRNE